MSAKFTDNIFRGYDIRAKIPDELNSDGAYVLGQAYAAFLAKRRINQAVAVGDSRDHTPEIKTAFIQGLIDSGTNVIDHGLGLVYFMYFSQYFNQTKGGVCVSASHNPKEYNGFKLAVGYSDTMISHEIEEFKQLAIQAKFTRPKIKGKLAQTDIFPHYLQDLLKYFPEKLKFKVFFDGGQCTPAKFMPQILTAAGCQVISQNLELDGSFPLGTPDPTETSYLDRVSQGVKQHQADLGLCYDADGDRLGIVDHQGRKIWNDVLVALFSQDVLDFLPASPIVFNALCSKLVKDTIKSKGGLPIMWTVGHSFIKAKVKESRAPFGGELSGHFFFMDNFYGHDDGAYATLRLLAYLQRIKKSLAQAVDELPQYISSPEIKLGLADEIKFSFVKEVLAEELKKLYPQAEPTTIDGIRLDTTEMMVIVRASQNGPYLTLKFEAKSETQFNQLKSQLAALLKSHSEIDFSSGVNYEILNH